MYQGRKELFERFFLHQMCRTGGTVVDVGAHVGLMTLAGAIAVGSQGIVIAIEPNPVIFERLAANVASLPQVRAVNCAVGADPEQASLFVPRGHSGGGSLRQELAPPHHEAVSVEVARLDDILPAEVREIDVLKIDVEGFEEQVLRGSRAILESGRVRNLMIEYSPHWKSRDWLSDLVGRLGPAYACFKIVGRPAWGGLLRKPVLEPFDRDSLPAEQCNVLISRSFERLR
jgi:FkbM family methyltransferase